MEKIILNLIKLQNQIRINHWQTDSYAQHKAFGSAYDALDDLLDSLVETYQGKYGKITLSEEKTGIELTNIDNLDFQSVLSEVTDYLSETFAQEIDETKDTDCLNIRDEILQELNKLKYLLTLK